MIHESAVAAGGDDHAGPDIAHIRSALGRFASGVTVVTTVRPDRAEAEVQGMTANAFTSVSLRPPLVLVSVANTARTGRSILATGRYGVSVLSSEQAPLSSHFAGGQPAPELVRFVWRDGVPVLEQALAQLVCTLTDSHVAGDHTLYIGRIERLWYRDGSPLIFYTGRLRDLPHRAEPLRTVAPSTDRMMQP